MALFVRILRAHWRLLAVVLTFSLAGAATVILIKPARYDGKARVTMNFLKPDPITGVVVNSRRLNAYIDSQVALLHDIQVIGPAVEASGWLDNPDAIAAYQARPPGDDREMVLWAAERIAPGIQTWRFQDSNILEIRFRALSPQTAKAIVSALRDAFLDANVRERRSSALGQAQVLQQQADKVRQEIIQLEAERGAYERKTGVVVRDDGTDYETLALMALAPATRAPKFRYSSGLSGGSVALARLDSQIADAEAVLGPAHPQLLGLRQSRSMAVAAAAAQAAAANRQAALADALKSNRDLRFESQKDKVIGQRDEVLHLRLLQDRIAERRQVFYLLSQSAGEMRQMSTTVESGLSIFGEAKATGRPSFPNKPLIMGGALIIGVFGGTLLVLLVEMLNFRIRVEAGLRRSVPAPVLTSLPTVRPPRAKALRRPRALGSRTRLQPVAAQ